MPSASRATTPVAMDLEMIEGRYAELNDQTGEVHGGCAVDEESISPVSAGARSASTLQGAFWFWGQREKIPVRECRAWGGRSWGAHGSDRD